MNRKISNYYHHENPRDFSTVPTDVTKLYIIDSKCSGINGMDFSLIPRNITHLTLRILFLKSYAGLPENLQSFEILDQAFIVDGADIKLSDLPRSLKSMDYYGDTTILSMSNDLPDLKCLRFFQTSGDSKALEFLPKTLIELRIIFHYFDTKDMKFISDIKELSMVVPHDINLNDIKFSPELSDVRIMKIY